MTDSKILTPSEQAAEEQEHLDRLQAMTEDEGDTWDLSDNDKLAIRFALDRIDQQSSTISEQAKEIESHEKEVRIHVDVRLRQAMEIKRLSSTLSKLLDGLQFYASVHNWAADNTDEPIMNDMGDLARKLLSENGRLP
jgi:hypothetical protein